MNNMNANIAQQDATPLSTKCSTPDFRKTSISPLPNSAIKTMHCTGVNRSNIFYQQAKNAINYILSRKHTLKLIHLATTHLSPSTIMIFYNQSDNLFGKEIFIIRRLRQP